MRPSIFQLALGATLSLLLPATAMACACGCGVFEVGTGSMLPRSTGTSLGLSAAYMDQNRDWSGTSSAPAALNDDRDIRTLFDTATVDHLFSRSWGVSVAVPYWQRHYSGIDDSGTATTVDHSGLGDVRILGSYTGFSPDLSTGLQFGLKLATGGWHAQGLDRDTQIGTGSTDLLLGGFHRRRFGTQGSWTGFVQGMLDIPVHTQGNYRPGAELDIALGTYASSWTPQSGVRVTPVWQALVSLHAHDRGIAADPGNTGYQRLLFAPGLEVDAGRMRLFADVGLPLYQHVRGHQLVAPWQMQLTVGYSF